MKESEKKWKKKKSKQTTSKNQFEESFTFLLFTQQGMKIVV